MKKTLCFTFALLLAHACIFGQITATPASICPGQTVTLTIPPQTGGTTYQWQTAALSTGPFTDITGQTAATFSTNSPGWYQVMLNGDPLNIIGPIELVTSPKPIVAFTFFPSNSCATEPVQFINTSSAGSYQWDFGNPASGANNASNLSNPAHRFIPAVGNGNQTFAVKLVVTNAGGCKDSITQNVTVSQLPDTKLNGTGAIVYNGQNFFRQCGITSGLFNFSNTSTTSGTNTNYQIIWGDAAPDFITPTFTTTSHTYTLGLHTLTYIITGLNGCKDTATYYVFVGTNPAVGLNNPGNTSVCINNTLTFPISGTGSNTPGTTYTVTFNDGSPSIILPHPPPADITHTFLNSSCGTTSSGYPNSFSGTIQASNACASSSAIVVPIYVSKKSTPSFSIAPGDTVCINKTVTLTNTTLFNIDNQNGNCNLGLAVWKITPNTGWTYTGSLGDDFGSEDVGLWAPGSAVITLNFTLPGTYTIKLKTGNSVCGNDSVTRTICVNAAPVAAFDIDKITGCTPLIVTTVNNSNLPICGTNIYQWSVSFAPNASCLQQTPTYTYINGTTANSANPQFQFNSPGVYTIGLVTTSSNGICVSPMFTRTVTVKGKPKVTLGSWAATICQNGSISPTAISTCFIDAATTYLWSFPGGTPASSTNAVPGPIVYSTPGTYSVSLTVTNECGPATVTGSITVNEIPLATVPATIEVCKGVTVGPITFTATLTGSSFSWTNNNTGIGLAATGTGATIPSFIATNPTAVPISGIITVTVTKNGCSSSNSFTITVNPLPVAPIVVTPINYCVGATAVPLTATALPGHSLLWYTVATGGIGSATPPTPSTVTAGTTDYYVSQKSASDCEGPRAMIRVIVNAVPSITATFTNPLACGGSNGTITISSLLFNTAYVVSYQKNSGAPIVATITSTTGGTIIITGLSAGIYSNIFVTLTGCPSNPEGPFTLTDPSAPAAPLAGSNSPICSGNTLNLTASPIAGATYTWTGPAGYTSGVQNPPRPAATVAMSGIYSVTATVAGCTSLPSTTTVVVNPTPSLPVLTSNGPICEGSSILLTANSTPAATYDWTGPNGFTNATQNPTITNATIAASGIYTVIVTLGTCTNTNNINVIVKPTPVISGASVVDPASCSSATGSIILNGLANNTTYAVSYLRNTILVNTTLTSNASGSITIINLTSGTYSNIMVTLNGCPSNMVGPFTLLDPTPPAAPLAGNNGPICSGTTLLLTASALPGATYNWSGPGGFVSALQNPPVANVIIAQAGTYTVTATVSGCTSLPSSTTVIINPTPAIPTLSSNGSICEGSTILLTANSTAGSTYSWTGPNGFTSGNQNPSISNAAIAASGIYTVVVTLGTCTNTNTINVLVKPTPNISSASKVDPSSCSSATGSIILNGLAANTTYTVTYFKNTIPASAIMTSTAAGTIVITNLTAGTYSNILVTLNGCPSNVAGPFTLLDPTPPASPVAGYDGPLCTGNTLHLTATTIAGSSYSWSGPGGFTSVQQNPIINNISLSNAGLYSVTVTVTGCTSLPATITVIINPSPVITSTTSNSPVCTGNTLFLNTVSPTAGLLTYLWNGPNSFTSNIVNPTIPNVTSAAAGKYYVHINLGSCTSTDSTIVIVNTTPAIIDSSKTDPTSCSTPSGTIILKGLFPNSSYLVTYTKAPAPPTAITSIADGTGKIVITGLSAGTYSNIFVTLNNCPSLPVGPFTLNDPSPPVMPVAMGNSPVCEGATLSLSATTTSSGIASYSWTGPNGFTSLLQTPAITNVSLAANGSYFVTVTINNCVSAAGSLPVLINPLPTIPIVATPIAYCINTVAIPLTATVTAAGNALLWHTVATGGIGSVVAPTPSTAVTGNTDYYVSQKTVAGCEGPRTMIRVVVNPDARALFIPTVTTACPAFQITTAVIGLQQFAVNSMYNWYADGNFIGTGTIFPGYTINNENDSVTIKLVTISIYGCKADSISRKFYTYKLPHPAFTKSIAAGCGPLTVQFTNTTPFINDFTYTWDFGNGQTSTQVQPGPIVFQSNPTFNDTTYVIQLKISTVCETVIYKDSVLVHSKPKALFTPNNVNGCSPMKVKFTNTSLGIGNSYFWNFDDGQTFTTTSTDTFTHIFYTGVIDTFHVKLIVTNSCGSDSISYLIITAPNNIHLNFSMNGTSQYGCAPHTVAFYNNSVGAGSFLWNFGDGNTITTIKNIDTVYHTYNLPGAFTVNVTAINNCTDTTAQAFITVYAKPVPDFSANNYQPCIGQSVQFTDNSTGAGSRQWSFGDGNFSSVLNPLHTYTTPGIYNVKLIVYNSNPSGNVCSDSITKQVQVMSTLPGNITVSAVSAACAPFLVTFANLNLPSVSTTWDFGDGFTGTGNNVAHTYTQGGTFLVHVIVTVPGGCVYLTDKTITVGGPAGSLQYNSGFTCYPLPVFLQASAINTTSYFWDFNDGSTQTTISSSVNHQYNNPGVYVPTVTFQGAQGCTVMVKGIDTIKVDKVTAGFTTAQSGSCGNTTVAFVDTSHAYFGKALVSWDYGDGQSGNGFNISHSYAVSNNYIIRQVVKGTSGCSDTMYRTINVVVKQKPTAFINGPSEKCAEQPVTFIATVNSVDPMNTISWKLSNGATGTGPSFIYTFIAAGNYSLQLIAGTVYGCFDTSYHSIVIKSIPVISASNDITLCRGNSAPLSVTGNAIAYQWSPLQGLSCNTCTNPTASPLVTTPYVVAGINALGCTVYDTVVITVIQPMNLQISGNDSICVGQSTLLQAAGAATYNWSPATGLSSSSISNPVASPVNTTIYRVIGYDGHNCYTDTAFITIAIGKYPTVSLGADVTLAAGTQYPLTTQITNGPIRQWLWSPATDLNCSTCPLPVANIRKDISYLVKVTTAYGCSATDTINIKVFCSEAQAFIANGFTPDGDGINDILTVRGTGISMVKHFRIFNRWGVIVFERDNFPPNNTAYAWDGKVKGKPVPPDIFVYTAEVICENGNSFTYKGNISLIK
jgi:gliding motility-associated-like protein